MILDHLLFTLVDLIVQIDGKILKEAIIYDTLKYYFDFQCANINICCECQIVKFVQPLKLGF